jgi:hypothetical protein
VGFHLHSIPWQSQALFDFEVLQLPYGSLCQVQGSLLGDLGRTLLGEPPGATNQMCKGAHEDSWWLQNGFKTCDLNKTSQRVVIIRIFISEIKFTITIILEITSQFFKKTTEILGTCQNLWLDI